jgi:hypothetical protein
MKKAITRVAALGAATVVGAAVLAPLGGLAHAAGGTPTQFYVASKSGEVPGLWSRTNASRLTPAGTRVLDMRGSQDGTRFVDVEVSLDATGSPLWSVVVYDVSGRRLGVTQQADGTTATLNFPALSPDGNTVVWNKFAPGPVLYSKSLVTGVVKNLGAWREPTFLKPDTLLVRDQDGRGFTIPASGGASTAMPTLPARAIGVTVSPDGTKIAWEDEYYGDPVTAEIGIGDLSFPSGVATLSNPWISSVGHDNFGPSFTRDGSAVEFTHTDGGLPTPGPGAIMSVPSTGGTAVAVDDTSIGNVITQAIGEIPPAATVPHPVPLPAILAGTSATVRWAKPSDPDVSQVLVRRYQGGVLQRQVLVSMPAITFRDTGLVVGKAYDYTFTAYDRGARASTAATWKLIATSAAPTAYDPTSTASPSAPFSVRFGTGPAGARWTVSYRINNTGTWSPWVNNVPGAVRTFGSGATTGVSSTSGALVPGRTYQFQAHATDGLAAPYAGNVTATVASIRTVVPFDQTSATLSGGTPVGNKYAWLGSYYRLISTSSYARITLYGNRLQVIAWRCSGCGSFALYQSGVRIATVSTYSTTGTKVRSVVYTRYWSTNATRSFSIKPLGTAGHPAVLLDGFAMRR